MTRYPVDKDEQIAQLLETLEKRNAEIRELHREIARLKRLSKPTKLDTLR